MYREGTATSETIPFPVGGWNTKDPLAGMNPYFAVELDNIFPEERHGTLRGGSDNFITSGLGSTAVETLSEQVTAAGVRKLVACADGKIFDATNSASVSTLKSGLTNNRWQTVHMNNRLLMFNGDDQPQQYDGTSISDATYTGISVDNDIIQATVYRNRLYVVPKNSSSFWYGGNLSITGALTEFPCAYSLQKGGYIQWVATWSREGGTATTELLVVCSSEGEILVYAGPNPENDGFTIVAHVFAPGKPIGRRSYLQIGSEIEILTQQGVVPLSQLVASQLVPGQEGTLTDKISPTFNGYARQYFDNFGWCSVLYPNGRKVLYNIPVVSGAQAQQFVRNSVTGAWCRFTGWNVASMVVHKNELYGGTFDGKIIKLDTTESDRGSAIPYKCKTAFNYFGGTERVKHVTMIRPLISANNAMSFGFGVDVDFESRPVVDTVTIDAPSGSFWDVPDWDTADWADEDVYQSNWVAAAGIGRAIAVKIEGQTNNVSFNISAFNVLFNVGGHL